MKLNQETVDTILLAAKDSECIGNPGEWGRFESRLRRLLESFLHVELPPCPICGRSVSVCENGTTYWCACQDICFDMNTLPSKQEAIDAYLNTPYCKLYLKDKQ